MRSGVAELGPPARSARASTCACCPAPAPRCGSRWSPRAIEATEFAEPLLLAQWVDLTVRRRAEQDRAELLLEQAARVQAEAVAERLSKLQALTSALEALSLDELLPRAGQPPGRAVRGRRRPRCRSPASSTSRSSCAPLAAQVGARSPARRPAVDEDRWRQVPLVIEGASVGCLRLALRPDVSFSPTERSLLQDAADRAALVIRRAQLHEEEHRIAVELQRGLIPKSLPEVRGVELAASYEVAGIGVAGRRRLVRRVRDAGRPARHRGGRRHRPRHPGGLGDGPAADADPRLRARPRMAAARPDEALTLLNRHQLALGDEHLFTIVYAMIDPEARHDRVGQRRPSAAAAPRRRRELRATSTAATG